MTGETETGQGATSQLVDHDRHKAEDPQEGSAMAQPSTASLS